MENPLDHLQELLSRRAMRRGQYREYTIAKAFFLIFGYQVFVRVVVGLGPALTRSVLEVDNGYRRQSGRVSKIHYGWIRRIQRIQRRCFMERDIEKPWEMGGCEESVRYGGKTAR